MRGRRALGSEPATEADVRPTLLGVVTLLFLLLFFLLSTSTGQRLGVQSLRLGSPADLAPLPHTGLVQSVKVTISGGAAVILFQVQTTDISASATSVEQRTLTVPPKAGGGLDLVALDAALASVHSIDPTQEAAQLDPDDSTLVEDLFRAMDVIKGPPGVPYFPKVTLTGSRS